jgi:DNA-directed RNA polymerase I, II, and III subunit RPABC2
MDDDYADDDDGGLAEVDAVVTDVAVPTTATGSAADPLEVLYRHHPETILDYAEVIEPLIQIEEVVPSGGDKHHKSQPFLSIYEKTKILSFRSNQLAQGARPYITIPEHVTNVLEIAKLELAQRRLPYIVKRPMPDRTFEYWRLSDLMII